MRQALILLLALGACSSSGPTSGVELTLRFDDSVSDDALAAVRSFSFVASGDEQGSYSFTLGRAAHREERIVYRSLSTSRQIGLAVTAADATSQVVASGSQPSIALDATKATAVEITLSASALLDAGMEDDGSVGDGSMGDGGTTRCMPAGKALCEDFEAGAIGPAWTMHSTNGSIAIDTAQKHRGAHSLHLHGNAVSAGTSVKVGISETETLPAASPPADIFVRAYYYVATVPGNAVELASVVQTASPYYGEQVLFGATGDLELGDSIAGTTTKSSTPIPTNSWFCLEWQVHVSAVPLEGMMAVWLDDVAVSGLSPMEATSPSAGLGYLSVDAQTYQPATANLAYDVWIDDVIVDDVRIRCGAL